MARPKKNSVGDAAKLADELIAAQAAEKAKLDEPAPDNDDNNDPPVDDLNEPADEGLETQDGFDLSDLDEDELPPKSEDKDLSHKLSVLQGKYNAETERLSALLSTTMTEVQNLKAQILRKSPGDPELADLSDDEADIDSLKKQFPNLYKSFYALARAEAKREVTSATKGTTEKVEAIVQQGEVDKKNVYYSRLTESLPSWEQINNHPAFVKWLNEPDEFSGGPRKNLLGAAYNRNDHATTLKFFNAFIKEKGIRIKGKPNDADDIAPNTSGGGRSNRVAPGEVTRAQIAKFYQDKVHKRLDMSEADIAKMEARFFQAVREGKVRP